MKKRLVLEQPKIIRFFHWTLVIMILTKLFTGLYLTLPISYLSFKFIRSIHLFAAYPLLFWFIARIYYAVATGDFYNFIPSLNDIRNIPLFLKHEVFLTTKSPPQEKYNVGQKIVFLSWVFIIIFLLLTGFALYDPTFSGPLDLLFKGYNYIRWYHYLAALYLVATIALHIYLVLTTDMVRMKAIFTGHIIKRQRN